MPRGFRAEKQFAFIRDHNIADGLQGTFLNRLSMRGWTNFSKQFFGLNEQWFQKPGVPGDRILAGSDTGAALIAYTKANPNWCVVGTNAVTADVTFRVGGGITLTTHASASDSTIVAPHTSADYSATSVLSWLTQKQTRYEATVKLSASVAAQTWWYGGKLTNTPVIATDDDQFMFRFDTTSTLGATYLHFITSRANVDVDNILSLAPVVNGVYTLVCEIDDQLKPNIYINGKNFTGELSAAGAAPLTTAKNLIPYTGILQTAGTPKSISILPDYNIMTQAA